MSTDKNDVTNLARRLSKISKQNYDVDLTNFL